MPCHHGHRGDERAPRRATTRAAYPVEQRREQGSSFIYVYDFDDYGRPKIVVEKVFTAAPGGRYPACVGGRRACPPEDYGGTWGYAKFLEAMLERVGGRFDPEAFDPPDFDRLVNPRRLTAI